MKKCNECDIKFNIDDDYCPLCNSKLEGECSDILFPKDTRYLTHGIFLKTLFIISVFIFIFIVLTEINFLNSINISLLVGGFLIANYLLIYFFLRNSNNILDLIGKNGLLINVLLIAYFLYTKDMSITNYIIPLVCIFELIFNLIAFLILKRKFIFNYFKIFLLNIVLLFIPVILNLLNWSTYKYFTYLCFVFGVISLAAIVIFYLDELKYELKKIFNN